MSSISSHQKNVITVQFKPILLFDRNLFVLNQSHELNLKITYIGHFSLIWGFFFPSLAALQFRAGKVFFLFEVFTLQKSDITKVRGLDYTTLFAMELDVREWITRKKPESPQTPNKYFFQRYKQQKWTKKKNCWADKFSKTTISWLQSVTIFSHYFYPCHLLYMVCLFVL